MNPALLILDVQNGFLQAGTFNKEVDHMIKLAEHFKSKDWPIYITRHIDHSPSSLIADGTENAKISAKISAFSDQIILKKQPSVFKHSTLDQWLHEKGISKIVIVGFNVEFCCLFNAIIAQEKGYDVTLIEDATATVNTETTYEMQGLDIRDFIATILHWSGTVEVLDTEEYLHA